MGADMDVKVFNYHARRAYYARLGGALKPWVFLLELLVVALLIFGALLLFIESPFGWLVAGLAAVPAMVAQWYRVELHDIPVDTTDRSIHARMQAELLSHIPKQVTPRQLAYALMNSSGGHFFEVRFGVGGAFLKEVSSDITDETGAIFNEALRIADSINGTITPGVLILAMVRQLPMRETLLGHLQLSEEDLIRGIEWYEHILEVINTNAHARKRSGGIGRDWSFGWIPNLARYGTNLSQSGSMAREEIRSEVMRQLLNGLSGQGGVVALVGKDGVGKTELVYELANRLIQPNETVPKDLWYQQVFMLDASRLVSVSSEKGGLERLLGVLFGEAFAAKNIIVCLDNAELFFEDGVGSVNLTTLLLPIIEAGRLRMILTLDEQAFLQISKRTPALTQALNRIIVEPTNEIATYKVLEDHVLLLEHKRKVTVMYQAFKEAYRLSQRYVYDVAMPGQAISLLTQAVEYAEDRLVTVQSVNRAIEHTTGVKTGGTDDNAEREMLLNLESLMHERMIGQDRAVSVVADALRRARSGVRNVNRPVGTFLFLGPTGVGKTELAKSLAAVYFGGEKNIIRLDMNEFVSPDDVSRLIADGADDPSSLTAQVMKQPFSVVLLDEIEKAHSSVLTTLLQLLDEGILRDVRNREISFRDTVVIATSNAGADRIQEYIQRGYSLQQFEETLINELISSHIFHPEFLNRFDEMVVFGPLEKPQLLQVVDLILNDINKNLVEQQITVSVAQDAKEYLVDAGYDPRLGARPMRRVVQKAVENTVAKLLLSNQVMPGGNVEITLEQVQSILDTHRQAEELIASNVKTDSQEQ